MKDYLRNLISKASRKFLKILVVVAIAFITWETIVKPGNEDKANRLIRESREVYDDVNDGPTSGYEITADSDYIYVFEK